MRETLDVAKQAALEIEAYLNGLPETLCVINVEDDPAFQKDDIDILWNTDNGLFQIEIKGDRYYRTGNYFFETVSNKGKNSLGCFMYTKADFIYYYFVEEKELHMLPMPITRDWFLDNMHKYSEKKTSTKVGSGAYFTAGSLVPRKDVANKKVVKLCP
jgi:hypothetical protein